MGKYLTVDEQATYIDVACDGYILRFNTAQNYYDSVLELRDPTATAIWAEISPTITTSSQTTYLMGDSNYSVIIVENSSLRVVLKCEGNFYESDESTPLTNSTKMVIYFYIYFDRMIVKYTLTTSGDVTTTTALSNLIRLDEDSATNAICIAEDSGIEDQTVDWSYATGDYNGFISDDVNVAEVNIYHTDDAIFDRRNDSGGGGMTLWRDGTLSIGDHIIITMYVIDSADRENDGGTFQDWDTDLDGNSVAVGDICVQSADDLRYICHTAHTAGAGNEPPNASYWHEYRITLGDQYKDFQIANADEGNYVSDLNIPYSLTSRKKPSTSEDDLVTGITGAGEIFEDIVAAYLINENTGSTIYDHSGEGNNLTITSGCTLVNDEADFSGSIDVEGGSLSNLPNTQGTIIVKGNFDTYSGTLALIELSDATANNRIVLYNTGAADTLSLYIIGGGSGNNVWEYSNFDDLYAVDEEFILVVTFDTSTDTYKIYHAGVELTPTSTASAGNPSGIDQINLGSYRDLSSDFDGQLSAVYVFNRVLSEYEAMRLSEYLYIAFDKGGKASDGTGHCELDATNKNFKQTIDATRIGMNMVVHDAHIYTGDPSSPDDHLLFWDKMDSIADGHSPEVGTGTVGTTPGDLSLVDGVRGDGVEFDTNTDDGFEIHQDNLDPNEGTIILNYIPNWSTSPGTNAYLLGSTSGNERLYIDTSGNLIIYMAAFVEQIYEVDLEVGWQAGMLYVIKLIWKTIDASNCHLWIYVNEKSEYNIDSGTRDLTLPTNYYIGQKDADDNEGALGIIDEFKIYDKAILPYGGGPFHGNDGVETDVAHQDILSFVKCDQDNGEAMDIGTGNVSLSGPVHATDVWGTANAAIVIDDDTDDYYFPCVDGINIEADQGSISFWYKNNGTTPALNAMFFWHDSGNTAFRLIRVGDTEWQARVNGTSVTFSNVGTNIFDDGLWHYVSFTWDTTINEEKVYIDGQLKGTETTAITAPALASGNIYIGKRGGEDDDLNIEGTICDFVITNNPNTPDNWSVLGAGPRHMLIRDKQ